MHCNMTACLNQIKRWHQTDERASVESKKKNNIRTDGFDLMSLTALFFLSSCGALHSDRNLRNHFQHRSRRRGMARNDNSGNNRSDSDTTQLCCFVKCIASQFVNMLIIIFHVFPFIFSTMSGMKKTRTRTCEAKKESARVNEYSCKMNATEADRASAFTMFA